MTRPHVPMIENGGEWYGYGVIIQKKRGVLSYGHGEMAPGTQFEFAIYPELDTMMVVLSNYDTIAPHEIASVVDEIIRRGQPNRK